MTVNDKNHEGDAKKAATSEQRLQEHRPQNRPKTTPNTQQKPRPKTRKSIWRRLLIWGVILVLICAACLAIVWAQRYAILEAQGTKKLAALGFEGQFEIKQIGRSGAVIENIQITPLTDPKAGTGTGETGTGDRLEARRLELSYQWQQALKGHFEKITIIKPKLSVQFDAAGHLTGGGPFAAFGTSNARPQGGFALPEDGVFVKDALLTLKSPAGGGQVNFDLDVHTAQDWALLAQSDEFRLVTAAGRVPVSFQTSLKTENNDRFSATGTITLPYWRTDKLTAKNPRVDFSLDFQQTEKKKTVSMTGWQKLQTEGFSLGGYAGQASNIFLENFKGRLDLETRTLVDVKTGYRLQVDGVSLQAPQDRQRLAALLTAREALQNVPVAKEFIGGLAGKAEALLQDFDLDSQGVFDWDKTGYRIHLDKALTVLGHGRDQGRGQKAVLTPIAGHAALEYDNKRKILGVMTDVSWTGRQALEVKHLNFHALSENGIKLEGLEFLSAQLASRTSWQTHLPHHQAHLAPFVLDLGVRNKGAGRTEVQMSGGVVYDGPVPGGEVKALTAAGKIVLRKKRASFTLDYTPKGQVFMSSFRNTSGWRAENIHFAMPAQDKLLTQGKGKLWLTTSLENVKANLVGPQNQRHLQTGFAHMDIKAVLTAEPQDWAITFRQAEIRSDDFPAPASLIKIPAGAMDVQIAKDGPLSFQADIPDADIDTENFKVRQVQMQISGTPDDVDIRYENGRIALAGGVLPVVTISGKARLRDGVITGRAATDLPKTKDTPLDISFRSENGVGTAIVNIDTIDFTPNGLQPQYLVPALRGRLADVSGTATARLEFGFGGGQALRSKGVAKLINMDIGTLVGPLSGVNAELKFKSIFPLETEGVQTASIASFDPGFPLKNAQMKYKILPDGIEIKQLFWPVKNTDTTKGEGRISIDPTLWKFGDVTNKVTVRVKNIGLERLLVGVNKDRFSATGQITGVLPVAVKGVNLVVENGYLEIKEGGVIKFKNAGLDTPIPSKGKIGAIGSDYAFAALKNFKYNALIARLNGPLDGPMQLEVNFDGKNEEVLGGQVFRFNTTLNGELGNIMRNLSGSVSNRKNLERILEIKHALDKPKDKPDN